MARKGGKKSALASDGMRQKARVQNMTLREEKSGKKHVNPSDMLRMEHLQNIAAWASSEVSIPCLAALFGRRLAANAESVGVPLDRSLFLCQRCETILQPGDNCTVRIEKNVVKSRRHNRCHIPAQNSVVYTCSFCSHRNLIRGTTNGYVKELLSSNHCLESGTIGSKETKSSALKKNKATTVEAHNHGSGNESLSSEYCGFPGLKSGSPKKKMINNQSTIKENQVTPCNFLHEKERKIDGSESSKAAIGSLGSKSDMGKSTGGSSKRKRKGWTSLREIAERNEQASKTSISNSAIPFKL